MPKDFEPAQLSNLSALYFAPADLEVRHTWDSRVTEGREIRCKLRLDLPNGKSVFEETASDAGPTDAMRGTLKKLLGHEYKDAVFPNFTKPKVVKRDGDAALMTMEFESDVHGSFSLLPVKTTEATYNETTLLLMLAGVSQSYACQKVRPL